MADPVGVRGDAARARPLGRHRRCASGGTVITSGGHGFSAMSRKAAARDTAATDAPSWACGALPDRGARPGRRCAGSTTSWSPPTGRTRPCAARVRRRFGPTVETAEPLHVAGHRPGLRRLHLRRPGDPVRGDAAARLPVRRGRQHVHRGDARGGLAAGVRFDRRAPTSGPGRATASRSRRSASCSPTCSTGPGCTRTTPAGSAFPTVRMRDLAGRQRGAARRRRAHRALLHRLGHQAGHGGRAGAGRLPARAARPGRRRWPATRRERRPVVVSTQRAAQASLEWFEDIGHYVHQHPTQFAFNIVTRSRRVTHDNLRLRDPEFVAARRAVVRRSSAGSRRRRCSSPFRLGGLELRNRVVVSADGHVLGAGRPARPSSTSCTWAARRSAGPGW